MDIHMNETTVQVYQDLTRLTKSAQITMESVVPDTKDDIGRILSVRPELYLKSKEIRNHSASVTAEAVVSVLYINELEDAVSHFQLTQNVALDYELPLAEESDTLQLRLSVANVQARVLNPRKLSVDLELMTELTVSRRSDFTILQSLPADCWAPVHLQTTEAAVSLLTAVCEKSFSLNEQLQFGEDAQKPRELMSKETSYRITEREAVGGRLLVKGTAQLRLNYLPEDSRIPASRQFELPFSLLVDLGDSDADSAEIWITPTSDYVDLIDAVDGKKLLDVELHALAQVRARQKQQLSYISDAYSNLMPCQCDSSEVNLTSEAAERKLELTAREEIELPEEFQELIACYPSLGQCTASQGTLTVDFLCLSADGKLFPMRRNLTLTPRDDYGDTPVASFRLSDMDCRQEERALNLRVITEGEGLELRQIKLRRVDGLLLDEEQIIDQSVYPSMTAVWAETESVWELAKIYHSSPEAIRAVNENLSQNPVFIPKTK